MLLLDQVIQTGAVTEGFVDKVKDAVTRVVDNVVGHAKADAKAVTEGRKSAIRSEVTRLNLNPKLLAVLRSLESPNDASFQDLLALRKSLRSTPQ